MPQDYGRKISLDDLARSHLFIDFVNEENRTSGRVVILQLAIGVCV